MVGNLGFSPDRAWKIDPSCKAANMHPEDPTPENETTRSEPFEDSGKIQEIPSYHDWRIARKYTILIYSAKNLKNHC